MAAWLITSQKNGMSAQSLQRVLGLGSYETAWAWLHKFRRAMVRENRYRLTGLVEVGEVVIGEIGAGHAGAADRACVMVAAEKPGPGRTLGRIRLGLAARPGTSGLVAFAENNVEPGARIRTNGAPVLRPLECLGYTHESTFGGKLGHHAGGGSPQSSAGVSAENGEARIGEPPAGVHLVASLLKRWLTGTLHYGVAAHHLPYYLDEFVFRFNRRAADHRGLLFYRLMQQAVLTDPKPLEDILDPDHNPYTGYFS